VSSQSTEPTSLLRVVLLQNFDRQHVQKFLKESTKIKPTLILPKKSKTNPDLYNNFEPKP
jgi:hypothetical protein